MSQELPKVFTREVPAAPTTAGGSPPSLRDVVFGMNARLGFSHGNAQRAKDARDAIYAGTWKDVPIKDALFAHYQHFVREIWKMVEVGRKQFSTTAGCCEATNKLRELVDSDVLLNEPSLVPKSAYHLAPLRQPLSKQSLSILRALTPEKKVRQAAQLLSVNFGSYVCAWEIEAKRPAGPKTLSPSGKIDLYRQVQKILAWELTYGEGKVDLSPEKRIFLEKKFQRAFNLSVIIQGGLTGVSKHLLGMNSEEKAVLPYAAMTSSTAQGLILHAFGTTSPAPALSLEERFARAAEGVSDREVHQAMEKERRVNNTSATANVLGCPVIGTPAFQGVARWAEEIRALVGLPL